MCKKFHLQALYGGSVNSSTTEVCFFFRSQPLITQPCWPTADQWRVEKGWFMTKYTRISATHAGLVHDITDTGYQTQNGSTCIYALAIFWRQFFTKYTQNQLKNCSILYSFPINRFCNTSSLEVLFNPFSLSCPDRQMFLAPGTFDTAAISFTTQLWKPISLTLLHQLSYCFS